MLVGLAVLTVFLLMVGLGSVYRRVGPNQALIVYGSGGTHIVTGGGKVVWQGNVGGACGVERLPNGHTLVATANRVVELDRAGKTVWEKKVPGYARRVHRR